MASYQLYEETTLNEITLLEDLLYKVCKDL